MGNLLKISILVSISGIIALFLLNTSLGSPNMQIKDINQEMINEKATIQGEITYLYISKDGHVFLKVKDESGEIKVVIFKDSGLSNVYGLEEGQKISVSGKIQEYKGELEIIARDVK